MTLHTNRGARASLWVTDDFGNLERITFTQLAARVMAGWGEL
jgi:hypothetical protein